MHAGYDDGSFEDRESLSLSAWLSTAPAAVVAQGLGVTKGDITRHLARDTFTFLPLGPAPDLSLEEFRARIGRPPQQPVALTHRFQLAQVIPEVRPDLARPRMRFRSLIWLDCACILVARSGTAAHES